MGRLRACLIWSCAFALIFGAIAVSALARSGSNTDAEKPSGPPILGLFLPADEVQAAPALGVIRQVSGKITFLRVHQLGSGYGPPTDFIDVEVVLKLDTQPGKAFGFQLRNDAQLPAHKGMLQVIRSAFEEDATVTIDYDDLGQNNSVLLRVMAVPPPPPIILDSFNYLPMLGK